MSTSTDTDILSEVEGDFAKPCDVKDCPTPAQWAIWFKHGIEVCPDMMYMCTEHKEGAVAIILRFIKMDWMACKKCNDLHMGGKPITEYIRPMEL